MRKKILELSETKLADYPKEDLYEIEKVLGWKLKPMRHKIVERVGQALELRPALDLPYLVSLILPKKKDTPQTNERNYFPDRKWRILKENTHRPLGANVDQELKIANEKAEEALQKRVETLIKRAREKNIVEIQIVTRIETAA